MADKDYRQISSLQVVETKMRDDGAPAIAIRLPEVKAYIVYDDPEQVMALAKHLEQWAAALVVRQRKGNAVIHTSLGYPALRPSIHHN